ncbi:MAG: alpha/beta fold hydrolase [Deltaproteobacteria bacterium]|nr:alpha/beta fold hydrolase [Deltaproteobacteria bacterium]
MAGSRARSFADGAAVLAAALLLGACSSEVDALQATPAAGPSDTAPAEPTSAPVEPPPPVPEVPYPIVLEHGMAGWDSIAGYEYFYRVKETLSAAGYAAFTTRVDPYNAIGARGIELARLIDDILAQTGANKVHLVGHSQGGLDARYVVSTLGYGDRVATVTTLASPHQGCKLVDVALGLVPGAAVAAMAALFDVFAGPLTGTESDLAAQLADVTHANMTEAFNPANPDDPRVAYYSWTGWTQANPFVDTAATDIVNPMFLSSRLLTELIEGTNDGLVGLSSAKWGTYFGAVPADHLDEVGLLTESSDPAFDHLDFFLRLAAFLYGQGEPPVYDTTME